MARNPLFIRLTEEDLNRISDLAKRQTEKYGHDRGFFRLGRKDSSHEIGFIGEIGLLRFFKEEYGLEEPNVIGLWELGDKRDVYILIDGKKYTIHVKTGRWKGWPEDNWAFGVHLGQKLELSGWPVVLISYLTSDNAEIRIEGFITSDELGKCPIIKRGKSFPGMFYLSRCDNWLTKFDQYNDIKELINYLKTLKIE